MKHKKHDFLILFFKVIVCQLLFLLMIIPESYIDPYYVFCFNWFWIKPFPVKWNDTLLCDVNYRYCINHLSLISDYVMQGGVGLHNEAG